MSASRLFSARSTTTRFASAAAALTLLSIATLGAACGSEDDPNKFPGLTDGAKISDDGGINFNPGGDSTVTPTDGGNGCTTAFKPAAPPPLHLVVLLDASGSMIVPENNVGSISRFEAVKRAWVAYAGLAQANPVSASFVAFGLSAKSNLDVCREEIYPTILSDTSMPAASAVEAAITAIPLSTANETPTAGGELSGLRAARALKAQFPADDVAIILSTDGAPSMCGTAGVPSGSTAVAGVDNDPAHVAAAIAAVEKARAEGFKTYVVGVLGGSSATANAVSLSKLATAGGTMEATNISGSSTAAAIAQQLSDKVTSVSREFQCKLPLTADALANLADTNVIYKASAASGDITLVYSQGCPSTETRPAYQYDNAANPTSVVLCAAQCNAFTSTPGAEVTLAVGCTPRVQ